MSKKHKELTKDTREQSELAPMPCYHSLEESETIGGMVKDSMLCMAANCDNVTLRRLEDGRAQCPSCCLVYDF